MSTSTILSATSGFPAKPGRIDPSGGRPRSGSDASSLAKKIDSGVPPARSSSFQDPLYKNPNSHRRSVSDSSKSKADSHNTVLSPKQIKSNQKLVEWRLFVQTHPPGEAESKKEVNDRLDNPEEWGSYKQTHPPGQKENPFPDQRCSVVKEELIESDKEQPLPDDPPSSRRSSIAPTDEGDFFGIYAAPESALQSGEEI